MLKRLLFRLRGALLSWSWRSHSIITIRYAGKFFIFLYMLVALFVYLRFLRGSQIFIASYQELLRSAAQKLNDEIPRVKGLDCGLFMDPTQPWSDKLDNLSHTAVAEEVVFEGNCDFLQRSIWKIPTSPQEQSFPIAYSIMVYTDFDRFVRLLRAIYRQNNVYCVHVDQHTDQEFKTKMDHFVSCFDNVFQPDRPISVEWGFSSVLEAELVCLRALWNHKINWLAFINLTGQEFPLKTNLELVHILQIMGGQNDVWIDPCTYEGPGDYQSSHCQTITPEGFRDRWSKVESPPYKVVPYKGQVHVVLFRAAVDFILHSFVSRLFLTWVNKTDIPDELYFTTLNSNPHIGIPGGNKNPLTIRQSIARFKLWWNRHGHIVESCDTYVRNICQLTPRELTAMTRSRQLFANKFKVDLKPAGYSCLEEWFYQRVMTELRANKIQLDLSFYRQLFSAQQ
ncbi:Beta-1,3-galactosyl-O-glycosyl-glycoprotein beta-1,6-N-acetylglucosaminyltransferase [Bulinus truncatus]|nr:Beta-1,3-galactosyl-O-glycosyl-glycoprotein beta-1,6-N-acetylglucosaminyltransferase [Bulinus truncatus]